MTFQVGLEKLGLVLVAIVLLGSGMLLSACDTVAGAGQDVSNVGYGVSSGAQAVQRDINAP